MHSRLERLELLFRGHLLTLLGLQAGVVGFREHLGTIFLAAASHMFEFLRLTPMTRSGAFAETSFLVLQGINEGQKIKFAGQGESV